MRVGTTGDSPVNAPSVLVTVGQAVTLTFKVRQTAARSIHCYAEMNPGYVYTEADGGAFIDSSAVPVNTWVTLTRTFTVPAGASEMTLTLRHNSAAAGDILYIDDIMLEQGGIGGNVSPSVSAGPDQTRAVGQLVTLTAVGADTDGTIASYAWTQTAGTAVTLAGTGATRTFTPASVDSYTFSVTATDNAGAVSQPDTVTVTVTATEIAQVDVVRGVNRYVARVRVARGGALT